MAEKEKDVSAKETAKAKENMEKMSEVKPKETDDEKVRRGEKDPAKPESVQAREKALEEDSKKQPMERPNRPLVQSDEEPRGVVRNDPADAASFPGATVGEGLDRDQTIDTVRVAPDVYHAEPSTYTPSGARPGQQNPVNPQGSPGADPHAFEVGARPNERSISQVEVARDGDYTKVMTEGEKNPSQLPVEIDHQPMAVEPSASWTHDDSDRRRETDKKRG